jgi:hypothetical protein
MKKAKLANNYKKENKKNTLHRKLKIGQHEPHELVRGI